jgi:hypothetical protein
MVDAADYHFPCAHTRFYDFGTQHHYLLPIRTSSFGTLQNPTDEPYHRIMREAHVIAAPQRISCALNFERHPGSGAGGEPMPRKAEQHLLANVSCSQTAYGDLKQAAQKLCCVSGFD